jgi:hypothetical protein
MQIAFPDSANGGAFTRPGGRCECTRGSHPLIPASWRHAPPPAGAGVNKATGTSARPGTWWDHLRERASNGLPPGSRSWRENLSSRSSRTPTANITGTLRPPAAGLPPGRAGLHHQAGVRERGVLDQGQRIADHDLRLHRGVAARWAHNASDRDAPATPDGAWHRGPRGGMSGRTWRTATNPATTASAPPRWPSASATSGDARGPGTLPAAGADGLRPGANVCFCGCPHAVLRMTRRLRELFSPELVQMLDNPVVLPAEVAVGFWPKPVAPGIMPVIAAQVRRPGLCAWPQGWPHTVPAQRPQRIPGALVDAGGWIGGRVAACARLGGGCGMRSTCRKGKRRGC